MKPSSFIATILFLFITIGLWAQGSVSTYHNERLNDLLFQEKSKNYKLDTEETISATGYRVQIYSSNASRQAKEIAFKWKENLEKKFPEYKVYVQYQAPFWKVRIGDFTHYGEATTCSHLLKQAYPKEANEIIIVKEKQVKPIYFQPYETGVVHVSPTNEFSIEE
jgi:hypothetical protein